MALPLLAALAPSLIKGVFGIIDEVVEDKDEANKIKLSISSQQHELMQTHLKGSIDIILAEAKGNWLQKSWRPVLMLSIVAIVVNNYILFPYLSMFTDKAVVLELPGGLYSLLTTGVGGYVVGRSAEKVADIMRK